LGLRAALVRLGLGLRQRHLERARARAQLVGLGRALPQPVGLLLGYPQLRLAVGDGRPRLVALPRQVGARSRPLVPGLEELSPAPSITAVAPWRPATIPVRIPFPCPRSAGARLAGLAEQGTPRG